MKKFQCFPQECIQEILQTLLNIPKNVTQEATPHYLISSDYFPYEAKPAEKEAEMIIQQHKGKLETTPLLAKTESGNSILLAYLPEIPKNPLYQNRFWELTNQINMLDVFWYC